MYMMIILILILLILIIILYYKKKENFTNTNITIVSIDRFNEIFDSNALLQLIIK